jgi:hypothetical protein
MTQMPFCGMFRENGGENEAFIPVHRSAAVFAVPNRVGRSEKRWFT